MVVRSQMFLTFDEVRSLTERVHHSAQVKVLCSMGIEHRVRPDGSIAVLRQHIEQLMGAEFSKRKVKVTEPNWGALNAARA
ncbi:DUF4224 domain-containing protein [Collimonas humicola]|uniref:DUF4224 domain-containing protein n=1 Tax=Collimonas humicola TaxID=2825886 RepID=UPI001B8BEE45|nr:DUF4224 domain-containing protein [Collimonas humicola]